MRYRRIAALGGIAGPLAFIAAWAVLGARAEDYAPTRDPISRLAAAGAPTQPEMTGGFLAFGIGVLLYAGAVRRPLSTPTAMCATATALATACVAALPLDGALGDRPHAVAAGAAYIALALTPFAGAFALERQGRRRAAMSSVVTGVVTAAALAASAVGTTHTGLLQRVGLSAGDVWIMATAYWVAARTRPAS